LNGALLPLGGLPGRLFSPLARLFAASPWTARAFAWRAADRAAVVRLIRGTGSVIDPEGIELYARLVRSPAHVAGALGMMASWDLRDLARGLPALAVPLTLVVGENDRTVPPADAQRVRALVPAAQRVGLPGLGHLAHEERPEQVAALILSIAREAGAVRGASAR
jgi:magnesium chelatase accessory protein